MKARYRLFLRRKSVFYAFDTTTRRFQSLETKDRKEAERLTTTLNEAGKQPAMNLRLAPVLPPCQSISVPQRPRAMTSPTTACKK